MIKQIAELLLQRVYDDAVAKGTMECFTKLDSINSGFSEKVTPEMIDLAIEYLKHSDYCHIHVPDGENTVVNLTPQGIDALEDKTF